MRLPWPGRARAPAPPPPAPPPPVPPAGEGEPPAPAVPPPPLRPAPARGATRGQRLGLVLGVLGALGAALWLFAPILTPFVLAACVAYFLDPPATYLARLGVPRFLAALLLVAAVAAVVLLAALLLYPLLVGQIGVLLQRLPAYVVGIGGAVREALSALEDRLGEPVLDGQLREFAVAQAGALVGFLAAAASRLVGSSVALFNVFTLVVVTPIVAFYLLRDWPRMLARLDSWLPRRSAATVRALARDTDRVLAAWLRGQLLCCALLAAYYAVGLSLAGLELGPIVGVTAGVLSFVPYVGSFTGLVSALVLALAQFGTWAEVGVVLAVFVSGQVIEGYVVYPRLLGDRVELHAVWVIFAVFAGGIAFGFLGVLLAVPMAATIGVVARHWLARYLASPLYLDPPRTG